MGEPVSACVPVQASWCGALSLQSLHVQKGDMDVLRARLQRLQEENSRKDRQIRQLLEPSHVSA